MTDWRSIETGDLLNISADICQESDDRWRASLALHPQGGGPGIPLWRKSGMRTAPNAESAMEAAYQRFQKAARAVITTSGTER